MLDPNKAVEQMQSEFAAGFQAGAASRDVEIAELVGVLGNVTAHLIAAHSLLSSGGKKAEAAPEIKIHSIAAQG